MELHIALRNIIETDGPDIINDIRLVNILSDFKAFDDIPASKYILRVIIADGFARKIQAIGEWNTKSEALCNQFANTTGFQYDYVYIIFQSIAFALGWINSISNPTAPIGNLPLRTLNQNQPNTTTEHDRLQSLIDLKTNYGNDLGVRVENLHLELKNNFLMVNFEVNGSFNEWFFGYISLIIYDQSNNLIQKIQGEKINSVSYTGFMEYSYKIKLKCNTCEIGKIIMYYKPYR